MLIAVIKCMCCVFPAGSAVYVRRLGIHSPVQDQARNSGQVSSVCCRLSACTSIERVSFLGILLVAGDLSYTNDTCRRFSWSVFAVGCMILMVGYRFILMVRRGYRDPPYHNWIHAFSVAHFCYLLVKNAQIRNYLR